MHALLISLMTYNLNYGNPAPATFLDAIERANTDVVLLQEVTAEWRSLLEKRFRDRYAHRAFHTGRAGGIAVLSKLAIKRDDLWHAYGTGAYFPAQRVVLETATGDVQVLNVHLRPAIENGSWIKGFLSTPAIRQKEIAAHWDKVDAALPTIVAGDFNEDPDGLAIRFLAERGIARVPTTGPTTWHYEKVVKGKPWDLLKMDIDHVLVDTRRFATKTGHVMDAGTSDHRPVVVTIETK